MINFDPVKIHKDQFPIEKKTCFPSWVKKICCVGSFELWITVPFPTLMNSQNETQSSFCPLRPLHSSFTEANTVGLSAFPLQVRHARKKSHLNLLRWSREEICIVGAFCCHLEFRIYSNEPSTKNRLWMNNSILEVQHFENTSESKTLIFPQASGYGAHVESRRNLLSFL